jgi:hypothetical protein
MGAGEFGVGEFGVMEFENGIFNFQTSPHLHIYTAKEWSWNWRFWPCRGEEV